MYGDAGSVRKFLEDGDVVDELAIHNKSDKEFLTVQDLHARTALQSVSGINAEMVELLLRNGASVSLVRGTTMTPLEYAASASCLQSVELLLRYKADVHPKNGCLLSPLAMALLCPRVSVGVVAALIDHGANVYMKNSSNPDMLDLIQFNVCMQEEVKRDIEGLVKTEMSTRDKCLAFAMAHHKRLGVGSVPNAIDPEVLRMILMYV
jgi:hypothetical protein